MSEIDELVAEQLDAQAQIAYRLASFIKLAKPKRTRNALENRLSDVNRMWEECRTRHTDLLKLADDTTKKTHKYFSDQLFLALTDTLDETRDALKDYLTAMQPNPLPPQGNSDGTVPTADPKPVSLALPSIGLPKFSGEITAWPSFRDVFKTLVVDRADLNDLQRLHYLKGTLLGEAARVLANTPVTESQYTEAWAILTQRYERKRAILYTHIQRVVDCPKVTAGSVHELKMLLDLSREVRAAFKGEERLTDLGEDVFVYLIVSKLDKVTRREWELSLGDVNLMPEYDTLYEFLATRIGAWETSDPCVTAEPRVKSNRTKPEISRAHQASASRQAQPTRLNTAPRVYPGMVCVCCGKPHLTYQCSTFLSLSVPQRLAMIQKHHRCVNCFGSNHMAKDCPGKYRCRLCQQPHHSLLHLSNPPPGGPATKPSVHTTTTTPTNVYAEEFVPTIASSLSHSGLCNTVLPTASVVLTGTSGRAIEVRALLDQGSQSSFISQALVQVLRPCMKPVAVSVTGIGASSGGSARHAANVTVRARSGDVEEIPISVLVLPKLTAYIPPPVPVAANLSHLSHLPLADRNPFSNAAIDLIIGADYYCRFLRNGLIVGPANSPSAQNTTFGWVLSGQLTSAPRATAHTASCHLSVSGTDPLPELLQAFWQIEEVPVVTPQSREDLECEEHFLKTHLRLPDGRYSVRLPFRVPPPIPIGDTARSALRTWLSNESRLEKSPDLAIAYNSFLHEYEQLGHMARVPPEERNSPSAVYLPHHVVVKETSSTTKARVVFNASAASSNGSSLNEYLLIGPKLQADLFSLILRWRSYKYVYAADLEKMFRQILVQEVDTDYQRIFWRPHPEEEVQEFRLLTVTYGTSPAPFLANRVLQQLIADEGSEYPLAVPILGRDTYVDDLMFGGDEPVTLVQARNQLTELLRAGGFRPYKWVSNDESLLAEIPPEDLSVNPDKPLGEDLPLKVLGIYWDPFQDAFLFRVESQPEPVTKRAFLSLISRVFDPLGWATPFIVSGKILMQRLWLHKVGWDEPLSADLTSSLRSFASQLTMLNRIVIPRWTHQTSPNPRFELHGYADASNSAYSAVVYLRVETTPGRVQVSLLYAKSKVAPLKLLSVPRLELCGAELLVRAITFVQRAMNLTATPVICWTDSMTVLAWLQSSASRWKVFVAHRVSKIQHTLPSAVWRHVPTGENPADCASRGISASALIEHPLWWQGPPWLKQPPSSWPQPPMNSSPVSETEERGVICTNIGIVPSSEGEWDLLRRFSSWPRLVRTVCYILRFINRLKRSIKFSDPTLNATEIEAARIALCRHVQEKEFGLIKYTDGKPHLPDALRKFSALTPFVDHEGIIRVGGRLKNSLLPFEAKHPVLLPAGHLADLLARHAHSCTMHGGLRVSLYFLRQRYWIVSARSVVKQCIHKCVACTRARAQCSVQLLGDLPKARVTPSRPFAHAGVDYAGPFAIRSSKGRGIKTHKAYIVIFVCLSTRAVHLEVADDYTTEGFLAAFDRFTARRGIPSDVYSDNGTNFVGADRELARRLTGVLRAPDLQARFAGYGLTWHFIPPSAPHFGGLWEAGVKSTKYHLKRVIGNFMPTFEEFSTLLCKIECILNSRPIGPLHDDTESLEVLTPGHLLTGAHLQLPPQPSLLDISENRLGRWQFVCRAAESFWKRWAADYLNSVQQRGKWRTRQPNLKVGDLVLLRSGHLPPAKWELGRITSCLPGDDGLVRVVLVRTAASTFKRPITQLCKLPIDGPA